MTPAAAYLDTSALVKLVVVEAETDALLRRIHLWPRLVSIEIAVVELTRALWRLNPARPMDPTPVIANLWLQPLRRGTLIRAGKLQPPTLRSLDAIHLASALDLVPMIGVFITYDHRLQEAARQAGLTVEAPA